MSEKSGRSFKLIALIVIFIIVFSVSNAYLIVTNFNFQNQFAQQQESINELQNFVEQFTSPDVQLQEIQDSIAELEGQIDDVQESIDNISVPTSMITPEEVYANTYRSVVLIRTPSGQGSGFLFNTPNIVVTNYHVVGEEQDIEIEFYDRTRTSATIIGSDAYSDVAVLELSSAPDNVDPLILANQTVRIGQQVIAIGNPLGLTESLSVGYISQVNRLLDIEPIIIPVFQLDLTIAPGSSGGPLLDFLGNIVGITNAGTEVGFSFAVPLNIMKRVVPSLIENGEYTHPFLGVSVTALTPEVINSLNIINVDTYQNGLLVRDVVSGSPADEAGLTQALNENGSLTANDIILSVDGRNTFIGEDLTAYLEVEVTPSETITLTLWRSGEIETVNITTTQRPPYEG